MTRSGGRGQLGGVWNLRHNCSFGGWGAEKEKERERERERERDKRN